MAPRILIAEQNDQLAASLEALLRRHGMAPERTRDGAETLSRIVAAAPDALLLGLNLPRLSGIDVLGKLRQSPLTRQLPVVVGTSPHNEEIDIRTAKKLGVAACLERPYRPEALLSALRRSLDGAKPATMDRHLQRIFTGRFSGICVLKGEEAERTMLFLDGLPVSLRPGFLHRDFGDYLQHKGILSAREYAYYAGDGGHRHEVLVRMGCMEYPDLLQEKLSYLTEELIEAFGRPPLLAEKTPFVLPPELQVITVNIPRIFHRGYRQHPRPAAVRQLLARCGGHYVAPSGGYFRHINFLCLSAEEKLLLRQLDGSRTLAECFEGQDGLLPLLRTFVSLGMLQFAAASLEPAAAEGFPLRLLFNAVEEEPGGEGDVRLESFADLVEPGSAEEEISPPAPPVHSIPGREERGTDPLIEEIRRTHADLKGKNHYEIFAMTAGKFSIGLLKERYFDLTRRYGPEVLMQLTGEEAGMVEEILASVATAYGTLSDVVKKERYDEMLGSDKIGLGQKGDDRFQAQVQFQSGMVFIEMEEWESAEKALQDACNIDPNSGVYLAHLAWAVYRNPENARSRAMLDKARQMLNRALALERTAQGFTFKGWMLLERGQDSLAELEFNKALKLDARILPARQGLRAIQEKREQEKKGLFRKMFR